MSSVDPFVIQWPRKWLEDPEIGPQIVYLNRYLHDLFLVTTGGTGSSLIEDAELAEKYPWPTTNITQTESFDYPTKVIQEKQFRAVTVATSYTANDYDFINATVNSTITLCQYPVENSVIIIRNGDGSTINLNGNGKNINGYSGGSITRKGTAINLHYFIDSDEWFAR